MITPTPLWAAYALAGIIIHLFVDWFLQNDWMAKFKVLRAGLYLGADSRWHLLRNGVQANPESPITTERDFWWLRHPSAYVHAATHFLGLLLVFPIWAAAIVGVLHFLIDLRSPLTWWKKVFRQTREGPMAIHVGMWSDQTAHIVVIALVAIFLV